MKKILALSTSYPLRPDSVSGIFVHNLYKAMADSWSIELLCPDDNRPSGGVMDGITVVPVRYMPKKLQTLGGAGGILPSLKTSPIKLLLLPLLLASLLIQTLIKARKADVIHANWAICGIIAAVAGKFSGKKVVLTLRGSDVEKSRSSAVFKWQLQLALAGADFIVCISESMKNDLLRAYPNYVDKIGYCLNGVDSVFFASQSAAIDPDGSLQILAVGALIPVKGFDVLLKALHLLPMDTHYVLTIVGEGPERPALQARIKHYGLEEKVILKSELPYRDIPEIMASSDLFVLSSRAEGRPNVVVEAIASGLPVVSSDLPGVHGLVKPGLNGWLFEVGNAQALSLRILQALENKKNLRLMGQSGREAIRAHSGWPATAGYYSKLFTGLITGTST
jgi:glycosyltransferase involved in cell wall biosynthesis